MEKLVRVLIVEDMAADAELNMREARKVLANCEFVVVEREEDFLNALRDFTPHLVLSDYTMPEFDGLSALRLTLEHSPDTPVIMVTGSINEDTAVECMKAGAANYVIKHSIKRLGTAILHALDERQRKIDHRKAQQGLFESEKRYRSLFELSPVGVILQDADTKIINVNDAYCQISGFRKEELIGKSVSMLAGSENLNTIDENRNRILSGETLRHEVRNRTKTGTEIVIELYESAITLVDGSHGILSIAVDITEKKKNEEAIRKQADFQQRLIDAIPIPVFYKDINGDYLGCNSAFSELMGLSKEAILGKKVSDIYNPQFASIYYQADLELIRTGGSQSFESTVVPAFGKQRDVLFNKATFPSQDGSVAGIIGSMTDISELKGLEVSLRQKNKDLEFLSDYAMKLSGVDADTNLNALITDELRSFTTAPLAIISGYIEKDKSLVPMHFSTDLADFENILDSLGSPQHNPFPIQIPDDYMQVLLCEPIIESNNLSELAFGQIPEEWFATFIQNTGLVKSLSIVLKIGNELFGTINLILRENSHVPDFDLLKSFAHITSVTLRRRKAEESLREREERLGKVVNSAQDAMIIIDNNGNVVIWNKSAEKMFGHSFEEAAGKHLHLLIAPERYHNEYFDAFSKFKSTGEGNAVGRIYEMMALHKNGNEFPVELALSSFQIENEWYGIGAIRDISERKEAQEALSKSEKRYRELFDANRDGMAVISLDENGTLHKLLEINKAGVELLGFDRDEILNIGIDQMEKNFSLDKAKERVQLLMGTNEITFETELLQKSGKSIPVEMTVNLIQYDDKPALLNIARNISERKFKEKLQKLQYNITGAALNAINLQEFYESVCEELSHLIDTSNFYIAFYNEKTGMMFSPLENEQKISVTEWEAHRSLSGRVIKSERAIIYSKLDILELAEKKEVDIIGELSEIWMGAPLFKGKKAIGLIAVQSYDNPAAFDDDSKYILELAAHELSNYLERKEAEDSILKLSKAVEQNPVGIMITSNSGIIEYVNPKFTDMTGYSLAEIVGKTPRILKSGKHNYEFYNDLWETIKSGKNWYGEVNNRRKDGTLYWESMIISPLVDENNKVINFIAVREDITEKKRMIEELKDAKEKAEESDRLKTAFLQNISHEIRTPLNGILGFSELLIQEWTTPEDRLEYNEAIQKSGKRLIDIVSNILDISIIETGQVLLTPVRFNFNSIVLEIYNFYHSQALHKNLIMKYELGLENELAFATADSSRVYQVLNNLVNNAVKFTRTGEIEFGYKAEPGKVCFFVKDTGIGIPETEQEKIFSRFYQVEQSSARNYEGAGLGLAISAGLVKAMGGKLWLESNPGGGTIFYFTLPAQDLKLPEVAEDNTKGITNQNENLILIAEDDETSYRLLLTAIKKFNLVTLRANNGQEAVEYVENNKNISLVLMDIKMPVMDGLEATSLIKKMRPDLPVIAQTAYAFNEDVEKAREAGCDDHISKPIIASKLDNLLKKYLKL